MSKLFFKETLFCKNFIQSQFKTGKNAKEEQYAAICAFTNFCNLKK